MATYAGWSDDGWLVEIGQGYGIHRRYADLAQLSEEVGLPSGDWRARKLQPSPRRGLVVKSHEIPGRGHGMFSKANTKTPAAPTLTSDSKTHLKTLMPSIISADMK